MLYCILSLQWERGNHMHVDNKSFMNRMEMVYNQFISCFHRRPDAWHDYAQFYVQRRMFEKANDVYMAARSCLPDCLLIYFLHADLLESTNDIAKAKSTYEELLEHLVRASEASSVKPESDGSENVKEAPSNDLRPLTLAYVVYMKFLRRSRDVDAMRTAFMEARRVMGDKVTPELYLALGDIETFCNHKPDVASGVYQVAWKKCNGDVDFAINYLKFLFQHGDVTNLRPMFERAISSLPPEKSHGMSVNVHLVTIRAVEHIHRHGVSDRVP